MSNKATVKQGAKRALTPKLRFPEFRDGPGWKDGKVGELVSTVTPPKKLPTSSYLEKGSFPIIDQSQREICGWTNDDKAVIAAPLPLIVFGDHTCALKFITHPFAQGADGIKILNARNDVGNEYLFHFLNFQPVVTEEYKRHFSILQEKRVSYPDIKIGEQQKIAECLTSLDKEIAAQRQKLDALKIHKKGLMQQLFPREGETFPRLRFSEFREQWGETQLEKICSSISSGRDQIDPEGDFDLYGSTSVIGKTTNPSFSGERILVARVGANAGLLTRASGQFGVTDNTLVVSLNPSSDSNYIFHYLGNININRLIFGSGQPLITGSILKNLRILIPSDFEQQKISTCLSSLDELITAQSAKLEALKTHKKGLMQQLFPSLKEVEA